MITADKLMYIPNNDTQNYPFCRSKSVGFTTTEHNCACIFVTSESLLASTAPAEPPPTIIKSNTSPSISHSVRNKIIKQY